jgi:hypothetical protein
VSDNVEKRFKTGDDDDDDDDVKSCGVKVILLDAIQMFFHDLASSILQCLYCTF